MAVAEQYRELASQLLADEINYEDLLRALAAADEQLTQAPVWTDCQQDDEQHVSTAAEAAVRCREAHGMLLQVMKSISLTHQQEASQQQQHTKALNAYQQIH